jgi:hypothetical protein
MIDYSELDVFFHRLAPDCSSDETLAKFYRDGYVLCHYRDIASFSESDYSDSTDIGEMVEATETGGICLVQLNASNDEYDRGRMLGVVPPESEPFFIGVEEDGTRSQKYTEPEEAKRDLEENEDIVHLYKGIELQELRELDAGEYLLSAYEPPYTTFTPWGATEEQIQALWNGEQLPIDEATSYSPDQTERLCEEYLREEYEYYPLIQPGGAGGVNQSFDLIGGIEDDRVFGEVKNTKTISESALDDLEGETDSQTRAFYFSRKPVEETRDGVEVVLLTDVLDTLQDIDRTRRMMRRMTTW